MTRPTALLTATMILFASFSANSAERDRTFGFGIHTASIHSINGTYTDGTAMRDAVGVGPGFGATVERWVGKHFRTGITASLAWMGFNEDMSYEDNDSPTFSIFALVFDSSYHFTNKRLRPFLSAGAGLYSWRITEDGQFGTPQRFEGEKLEKLSIGLKAGFGIEYNINDSLSLKFESAYNYILAKDSFLFGNEFTEQGILMFGIGVTYYLTTP